MRCWKLSREHWKRAETSNDPTQSSDRFATVSPADVFNRFDACCMEVAKLLLRNQSVRGIESVKANESHEDFSLNLIFFFVVLSFLYLWKIIRRISCNFINNWLKCYSLLCTKTVDKSIYSPPKRENIENYRKTTNRFANYCATKKFWNNQSEREKKMCHKICSKR